MINHNKIQTNHKKLKRKKEEEQKNQNHKLHKIQLKKANLPVEPVIEHLHPEMLFSLT